MSEARRICGGCGRRRRLYGVRLRWCYACLSSSVCLPRTPAPEGACYGRFSCPLCEAKQTAAYLAREARQVAALYKPKRSRREQLADVSPW